MTFENHEQTNDYFEEQQVIGNWFRALTTGFSTFLDSLLSSSSSTPSNCRWRGCSKTLFSQLLILTSIVIGLQVIFFKSGCSRCACADPLQALLVGQSYGSLTCTQIVTDPANLTYMCFNVGANFKKKSVTQGVTLLKSNSTLVPCVPNIDADTPYAVIGEDWYKLTEVTNSILPSYTGVGCYYLQYGGRNPCQ